MEFGKAVWFVGDGDKTDLALATAFYDGKADLVVLTANGNEIHEGVAHRAPADFGPEGGGFTYHLQSEK